VQTRHRFNVVFLAAARGVPGRIQKKEEKKLANEGLKPVRQSPLLWQQQVNTRCSLR
jgi:hypothetical protein